MTFFNGMLFRTQVQACVICQAVLYACEIIKLNDNFAAF